MGSQAVRHTGGRLARMAKSSGGRVALADRQSRPYPRCGVCSSGPGDGPGRPGPEYPAHARRWNGPAPRRLPAVPASRTFSHRRGPVPHEGIDRSNCRPITNSLSVPPSRILVLTDMERV